MPKRRKGGIGRRHKKGTGRSKLPAQRLISTPNDNVPKDAPILDSLVQKAPAAPPDDNLAVSAGKNRCPPSSSPPNPTETNNNNPPATPLKRSAVVAPPDKADCNVSDPFQHAKDGSSKNYEAAKKARQRAIDVVVGSMTRLPSNQQAAVLRGALQHPQIEPLLGDVVVNKEDPTVQLSLQNFEQIKKAIARAKTA